MRSAAILTVLLGALLTSAAPVYPRPAGSSLAAGAAPYTPGARRDAATDARIVAMAIERCGDVEC